ncbi:putative extracellular cellulase CelA/allergen Asp F7-like [Aspergillus stella-maris]|uniref:putative extracellular cellulase CelA/allergen Asp F7-like n=1 Tax=Aspergillus stella-maris TaxID=1810926 RepID=UPI003CCD1242
MKYQHLASLALALGTTVSAVPLKAEGGSCPAGYSPSVYYITVIASATAEPTSTSTSSVEPTTTSSEAEVMKSTVEPSSSSTYTSSVTAISTVGAIETIPAAYVQPSSSTETQEAAPTASQPTTKVAVAQPSTTTAAAEEAKATSTASSSSSKTSSASSSAATSGTATFYGGNLSGGTCSFADYTLPSGLTGVAYSGSAWDSAAECGACVEITGPDGNTVKAMIVDQCPECEATHLDLFESAFTTLASASAGIIDISYSIVPCSISTPLTLRNKSGTSAYWFSMQVLNANEAVKSLEVSTDGGSTWQETTRSEYNFFENSSGFGTESVDVRVTGVSGKVVEVKGVSVESGSSVEADGNC